MHEHQQTKGAGAPDNAPSVEEVTRKIDHVIGKIAKSKKWTSVRDLEEVKADLARITVGGTRTAPPLPVLKEPKPNGLAPYVPQNGEVEKFVRYASIGKNILVTGDTGCGKTHLVAHCAALMSRTFNTVQGMEGMREDDVVGYASLDVEQGASKREFVEGVLPVSMQTEDCWLYWDEPNATPAGIQFCCFSAMDDRRELRLTADRGRVIKAKKGFIVVGAMNEGMNYRGTSKLNDAMRNRFGAIITLGYLPADKEAKLLVDRTGVDKSVADKLSNAARQLRAARDRGDFSTPISTRALLDCCDGIVAGVALHDALECSIINQVSGMALPERKAVADILEAHFGKRGGAK